MDSLCGLAVTLALTAGAGAPGATHAMETVMQDDAQMLYQPPGQVRRNARRMAALGVDRVRLTASWSALAPGTESRRRPRFEATDSRDYPKAGFARLDRAVREVRAAGMHTMIDLAFFAPRWAVSRGGARGRHVWRPSPRELGRFSRAVAERYSGRLRDRRGARLPAVRLWTTWNEPNHPAFLQPQWERHGSRWRPASPHQYRRMHEAAYDQIKAVSARNSVLIGGLASFGRPTRGPRANIAPLRFVRELACVDATLRPLGGRCRGFRALRADGFAHHPYSLGTPPATRAAGVDRAQIGELDRLSDLLGELHRRGRIAQRLPLYLTEYGYETRPPDPTGLAPRRVARYLSEATYLAWLRPDVRSFPQFLLRDIGPDRSQPVGSAARWADYQTGLVGYDGVPKPAAVRAFELPLHAETVTGLTEPAEVIAFGQVRPGSGRQLVRLQRRDPVHGWVTEPSRPADAAPAHEGCAGFATDPQGLYARRVTFRGPATYRAVWRRPHGRGLASMPVTVGAPRLVAGGVTGALRAAR